MKDTILIYPLHTLREDLKRALKNLSKEPITVFAPYPRYQTNSMIVCPGVYPYGGHLKGLNP